MDKKSQIHETPWVVTGPLIMLAIPSAIIGWLTIGPVLFGDYFGDSIVVSSEHDVLAHLGETFHGSAAFLLHAMMSPAVYLAALGAITAWYLYLKRPEIPLMLREKWPAIYQVFDRKYYFDDLWIKGFAAGGRATGELLYKKGDVLLIDGIAVNGTANSVKRLAGVMRQLQTGYLYHYAFAMIIALTLFLGWILWLR